MNMNEPTWRAHPVFTNYELSDAGGIRSVPRAASNRWGTVNLLPGRELALFLRRGGYLGGNISVNGQRINFEIHVLVCEAWHGLRTDQAFEVRHLNGDRLDNRPSNLAWGTKSDNMQDMLRHGTHWEARMTHCKRGHAFDQQNTTYVPSGPRKRRCRACAAIRDANRPKRQKAG